MKVIGCNIFNFIGEVIISPLSILRKLARKAYSLNLFCAFVLLLVVSTHANAEQNNFNSKIAVVDV